MQLSLSSEDNQVQCFILVWPQHWYKVVIMLYSIITVLWFGQITTVAPTMVQSCHNIIQRCGNVVTMLKFGHNRMLVNRLPQHIVSMFWQGCYNVSSWLDFKVIPQIGTVLIKLLMTLWQHCHSAILWLEYNTCTRSTQQCFIVVTIYTQHCILIGFHCWH